MSFFSHLLGTRLRFRWEHMLWTETNSDHPCRDSTQQRKFFQQSRRQGRRHLFVCIKDALKEMVVHKNLRALCEARGPVLAGAERRANHLGPHDLRTAAVPGYLLPRLHPESRG